MNRFRSDPSGWIGAGIMIIFAGIACSRWQSSGLLFFVLMMFRDVLSALFLVKRTPSKCPRSSRTASALAYISSGLPLIYLGPTGSASVSVLTAASVLTTVGYTVSTIAVIELGRSFGVAPANRGWIRTGVYRFTSHPMYLGYLLAESSFVLMNPLNIWIFVLSSGLYLFRARAERRVVLITDLGMT